MKPVYVRSYNLLIRLIAGMLFSVDVLLGIQSKALADIDHDGKPDLLWQNYGTGQVGAWLLNGTTVTGTPLLQPFGMLDVWRPIGPLGDSRILWHNAITGELKSWLLSGATIVGTKTLSATCDAASGCSKDWDAVGTGHFHDGSDYDGGDIFWVNNKTCQMGVWMVNGTSVESFLIDAFSQPNNICVGRKVVGVARHGKPNIFWLDNGGNLLYMLFEDNIYKHPTAPGDNLRFKYYLRFNGFRAIDLKCDLACQKIWKVIGMDDVDYDGQDDLLWYNSTTGEVSAWLLTYPATGFYIRVKENFMTLNTACGTAGNCSANWHPIGLMTGSRF